MTGARSVHMLWISGPLSRLARLGLASFVSRGFDVTLWTYDRASLAGCGARLGDAVDYAPCAGSFAAVSSLFRYNVLAVRGGIWADMDIVALGDERDLPAQPFIASEKRRPFRHREPSATGEALTQITNCCMGNPTPAKCSLWQRATSAVESFVPSERQWENCGPNLLTRLMLAEPDDDVTILPPDIVNTVAWWNVPAYFLEDREPPRSPFLHLYASIWAKRGIDAEAAFPPNSLAGRLWREFGL